VVTKGDLKIQGREMMCLEQIIKPSRGGSTGNSPENQVGEIRKKNMQGETLGGASYEGEYPVRGGGTQWNLEAGTTFQNVREKEYHELDQNRAQRDQKRVNREVRNSKGGGLGLRGVVNDRSPPAQTGDRWARSPKYSLKNVGKGVDGGTITLTRVKQVGASGGQPGEQHAGKFLAVGRS